MSTSQNKQNQITSKNAINGINLPKSIAGSKKL